MAASKSRPPTLENAASSVRRIRAGMGDVDAGVIDAWSDDDYRRATEMQRVLGADGKPSQRLAPALEPSVLREMLRAMRRIGALAQAAAGDLATARGREALLVGAIAALAPDDFVAPGAYEVCAAVYRGLPISDLVAGSGVVPRALNVLPGSSPRGTQLPQAVGIAWAAKMGGKGKPGGRKPIVALAYLDAPATSGEDFHAGLNFAGVYRVPAVFVCANDVRITRSVPETVSETLGVKALAYGVPGVRVDGGDVLAVHAAVREAAERARRGDGATFIEAVIDSGAPAADPIVRFSAWLAAEGVVDAAADRALADEAAAEVAQAGAAVPRTADIDGPPKA